MENNFKFGHSQLLKVMFMTKNPETMINNFTWIPIYQELAKELAGWEN